MHAIHHINSHSLKDDNYLKSKMIQRWKMWIKFKKLFRHWMQYCENRTKPQKASIFRAFHKWKYYFSDKEENLRRSPYEEIKEYSVATENVVSEVSNDIELQQNAIVELNNQNRVLIDNTISGQKLALTIMSDNYTSVQEACIKKWSLNSKLKDFEETQNNLKANMESIVNFRLKIKEIDMENQELIVENEQLRKTSMDGIFLAQTWKELSTKIKDLSVDLADKSSIIQNLLDENNGLAQNINMMRNRANQVMRNYY